MLVCSLTKMAIAVICSDLTEGTDSESCTYLIKEAKLSRLANNDCLLNLHYGITTLMYVFIYLFSPCSYLPCFFSPCSYLHCLLTNREIDYI